MATTFKIRSCELVRRIDQQREYLCIDTRTNFIETLLRKSLDFVEKHGYEKLLKIPSGKNNEKNNEKN